MDNHTTLLTRSRLETFEFENMVKPAVTQILKDLQEKKFVKKGEEVNEKLEEIYRKTRYLAIAKHLMANLDNRKVFKESLQDKFARDSELPVMLADVFHEMWTFCCKKICLYKIFKTSVQH